MLLAGVKKSNMFLLKQKNNVFTLNNEQASVALCASVVGGC